MHLMADMLYDMENFMSGIKMSIDRNFVVSFELPRNEAVIEIVIEKKNFALNYQFIKNFAQMKGIEVVLVGVEIHYLELGELILDPLFIFIFIFNGACYGLHGATR
ncbi:MAG: hypothetical protein EZS28_000269 [Streblomastix strix]|uniref:Uncharacterized protein n=1 Tax=Streblomastix strix TaxID=222440 RepID=A0A5J4XAI4_9EUKA|nr:MAG: hypothetical protein EZS28_000269 [Streblomastix strix]